MPSYRAIKGFAVPGRVFAAGEQFDPAKEDRVDRDQIKTMIGMRRIEVVEVGEDDDKPKKVTKAKQGLPGT
jgi:hypothetical protein